MEKQITIKDLNSTFSDIDNPFSLFQLNINLLSFHFDELQSIIPKSENDFQLIGRSETRLKKTQQTTTNVQLKNIQLSMYIPFMLMYIKKAINYKLRPDLMIYKKGNWSQLLK